MPGPGAPPRSRLPAAQPRPGVQHRGLLPLRPAKRVRTAAGPRPAVPHSATAVVAGAWTKSRAPATEAVEAAAVEAAGAAGAMTVPAVVTAGGRPTSG
ncbi:hypothetical protein [Streptomyces sp. NPDC001820]|uniref:hypothetical protein n=1 Tax=Streptomyces sp. NPDC001820 TaxID=3364613 RepID=UPI0036CB1FFB